MKTFKVAIEQDWITHALKLVIYYIENSKIFVAKPVDLTYEEITETQRYEPTITMPFFIAQDFLRAMREELDNKGVKSDKDAKIEGTLDATKYHLEDLRQLLKLKK